MGTAGATGTAQVAKDNGGSRIRWVNGRFWISLGAAGLLLWLFG